MLYAPIEPERQGHLQTTSGHAIYHEVCGAGSGIPVLFLHGGPGSSINPTHRRFFDPQRTRVVLFDQRGCGRSTPRGAVECNTTAQLIEDIEALREQLGVQRWMLFGGSWGSTLALAYAQAHPERVTGCVLRGVFLATRAEIDWYFGGLRRFVPQAWCALTDGLPATAPPSVVAWYAQQVFGADREAAVHAARRLAAYEGAVMAVGEQAGGTGAQDADVLLDRARIYLHYLRNDCFLTDGALLEGIGRIAHLPAIIVQGRRDLVCPPVTAHTLHRRWSGSQLRMVEDGGHSALHPAMSAALVAAARDVLALLQ